MAGRPAGLPWRSTVPPPLPWPVAWLEWPRAAWGALAGRASALRSCARLVGAAAAAEAAAAAAVGWPDASHQAHARHWHRGHWALAAVALQNWEHIVSFESPTSAVEHCAPPMPGIPTSSAAAAPPAGSAAAAASAVPPDGLALETLVRPDPGLDLGGASAPAPHHEQALHLQRWQWADACASLHIGVHASNFESPGNAEAQGADCGLGVAIAAVNSHAHATSAAAEAVGIVDVADVPGARRRLNFDAPCWAFVALATD